MTKLQITLEVEASSRNQERSVTSESTRKKLSGEQL